MVLRRYFYKILFEIVFEVHIVDVLSKFKFYEKMKKYVLGGKHRGVRGGLVTISLDLHAAGDADPVLYQKN